MKDSIHRVFVVARREFFVGLASPSAWVFLVIFSVMTGVCTFVFSDILNLGQAELSPFFNWLPWLFMFLMPALGMPMWSEERRTGTFELTLSYPVYLTELVFGKYCAGMALLILALSLTLPIPVTMFVLGEPDIGAVVCGYCGALLVGSGFLSVSCFCSALSKSQTASFLLALLICAVLMFTGWDRVTAQLYQWLPDSVCRMVSYCTILPHYQSFQRGLFDTSEIAYGVLLTCLFLFFAKTSLSYTAAGIGEASRLLAIRDKFVWHHLIKSGFFYLFSLYVFFCLALTTSAFRLRIDCTADRAYSLSKEAREVAQSLKRPVSIRFYVSETNSDTPKDLLGYSERIKWLLHEFTKASNGLISTEYLVLKPDSKEEEAAIVEGLQPARNTAGDAFFLGLSVSSGRTSLPIPFLSPKNENLLEYEILRRILAVGNNKRSKVGVISLFSVLGRTPSPQTGVQGAPAWYIFTELNKDYDLVSVPLDGTEIPAGLDALMIVHPFGLTDNMLSAIDKYLVNGGKLAIFVDPLSSYALASAQSQRDYSMIDKLQSTLEPLLTTWGIQYNPGLLAADMNFKYDQYDKNGIRRTIPTALCITSQGINASNPITASLTALRMNYSGFFQSDKLADGLADETLVFTTSYSAVANSDDIPEKVLALFSVENAEKGEKLALMKLIRGYFPSAYKNIPADNVEPGVVFLSGDADMLFHDACVVQTLDQFGQSIVSRINDNITLIENVLDSLCGDRQLFALRSRVPMSRPLTKINESKMRADLEFKDKILAIAEESTRLERQVESLRKQLIASGGKARLSQDQQNLLASYAQKSAACKRQIRDLRLRLREDIDHINNMVRLINIVLVPGCVVLLAFLWIFGRKMHRRAI